MASRIVKHPAFPDVTRTVDLDQVAAWTAQGWLPLLNEQQEKRYQEIEAEVEAAQVDRPAGNASLEDWQRYAVAQGRTPEDIEGMTRDQIRDSYND